MNAHMKRFLLIFTSFCHYHIELSSKMEKLHLSLQVNFVYASRRPSSLYISMHRFAGVYCLNIFWKTGAAGHINKKNRR